MRLGVDIETIGLHGPAYAVAAFGEDNRRHLWMGVIDPLKETVSWSNKQMREMKLVLDGKTWIGHNIGLFDQDRLNRMNLYASEIIDTLPASHVYCSLWSHGVKDLCEKYRIMTADDEAVLRTMTEQAKAIVKACYNSVSSGRNSKLLATIPVRMIHYFAQIRVPESDWQNAMWLVRVVFPEEKVTGEYVSRDAERALRLWTGKDRYPGYEKLLAELGTRHFYDLHMRYQYVVLAIKRRGIRFFKAKAEARLKLLEAKAAKIEARIYKEYGTEIGSSKQLADLLFYRLDFQAVKYGEPNKRTGISQPSTDKEVIKRLLLRDKNHEHINVVEALQDHRELTTDSGDIKDYLAYVDADSVIHPDILPTATGTTRGSCSRPALQNVNKKEDRTQRDLFGPREGTWWYLFDYDQLELRILAWMANETTLLKWLAEGKEVYQFLGDAACKRVGLKHLIGTKLSRDLGKTLNFAIMYGAGAPKLAETILLRLDLLIDQPQLLLDTYFGFFPKVRKFQSDSIAFAQQHGRAITAHGYRLWTPPDEPHTAVDYRIQGTAGWIAKEAAVRVYDNVSIHHKDGPFFALDVHDEIIYEGKKNLSTRILLQIKYEMENNGLVSEDGHPLVTPVSLQIAKKHWASKQEKKLHEKIS